MSFLATLSQGIRTKQATAEGRQVKTASDQISMQMFMWLGKCKETHYNWFRREVNCAAGKLWYFLNFISFLPQLPPLTPLILCSQLPGMRVGNSSKKRENNAKVTRNMQKDKRTNVKVPSCPARNKSLLGAYLKLSVCIS